MKSAENNGDSSILVVVPEKVICRAAFVAMIKAENYYSDLPRVSLAKNTAGSHIGFQNLALNNRFRNFEEGWNAKCDSLPKT